MFSYTVILVTTCHLLLASGQSTPASFGPGGRMGPPPQGGFGGPGPAGGFGGGPGGCSGGGSKGGCPMHGFLRNVSEAARQSYQEIMNNRDLTKAQLQAELDAWAQQQSADVQAAYAESKTMQEQHHQEMDSTALANASPEAQQLQAQLQAIRADQSLTLDQERQQTEALMRSASQSVLNELHSGRPQMPPPNRSPYQG